MLGYEEFAVDRNKRQPILNWLVAALELSGCRMLQVSDPGTAPFRLTFETPLGERMGVLAYAFLANSRTTKNRPADEHRFQVKYGANDGRVHQLWQDPFALYTTIFLGVNLEQDFFVAADPEAHNPTRFYISVEFKEHHAARIRRDGWASWERESRGRGDLAEPVEVLVGGRPEHMLRLIRFERAVKGLDPGHRQLVAEKLVAGVEAEHPVEPVLTHGLAKEFHLSQAEILDLIASAPRLKMAVRGWVAEKHLEDTLRGVEGVEDCIRIEEDGSADIRLRYRGSAPIFIECKNVLRSRLADGTIRVDFQRTRAGKADPCSRFYAPSDFAVVAACLHSCTERWEFRYALTRRLDVHKSCLGKLSPGVRLDGRWLADAGAVLGAAVTPG